MDTKRLCVSSSAAWSPVDLPNEMILEMFERFPLRQLVTTGTTCKRFAELMDVSLKERRELVVTDMPDFDWKSRDNKKMLSDLFLKCGPNLTTIKLATSSSKQVAAWGLGHHGCAYKLAQKCPQIEEIDVDASKEQLSTLLNYAKSVVGGCNLTGLSFNCSNSNFRLTLDIIKNCPKIERLHLNLSEYGFIYRLDPILEERNKKNQNHLKWLSTEGIVNDYEVVQFLEMVANCSQLESLKFSFNLKYAYSIEPNLAAHKEKLPTNLRECAVVASFDREEFTVIARVFRDVLTELKLINKGDQDEQKNAQLLDGSCVFEKLRKITITQIWPFKELNRHSFPSLEHFSSSLFGSTSSIEDDTALIDFIQVYGSQLMSLELKHNLGSQVEIVKCIAENCIQIKSLVLILRNEPGPSLVSDSDIVSLLKLSSLDILRITTDGLTKTICDAISSKKSDLKFTARFEYN